MSIVQHEQNHQGCGLKQKYYRRNLIWQYQVFLLNRGYSIEAANAKIIDVFPIDSITNIRLKIKEDQKGLRYPYIEATQVRKRP